MKDKIINISGRGLCGSSGLSSADFFNRLKSGDSSIRLIEDWEHLPIRMASLLDTEKLISLEQVVIKKDNNMKRSYMLQMALYEALDSANLWIGKPWTPQACSELIQNPQLFSSCVKDLPTRIGVFLGVGVYPTSKYSTHNVIHLNQERGWDRYDQTDFADIYANVLNRSKSEINSFDALQHRTQVEQSFLTSFLKTLLGNGFNGPDVTISNLCVSSLQAIGEAYRSLQIGEIDLAIVGGIEEYSFLSSFSFASLGAYADVYQAEKASRPFDRNRRGIVLGEGCGLLVLEREASIYKRKHYPLAEIIGYGGSNNHHHMTSSPSSGEGLVRAIDQCLEKAGNPKVDMCIAHGTGTLNNDLSESMAIKSSKLDNPLVQSIKSFTGHTLASAGVYNVIAGLLQQEKSFFMHTLHLDDPDPLCDLNHIPKGGLSYESDVTLINASGFGGMNACLLLKF